MVNSEQIYEVKNRSMSMVVYKIPEDNIRREFAPGEVKRIPYGELEKLSYQAGGRTLIQNYLQFKEEVPQDLNLHIEPEYFMSEQQIVELLQTGSLDAFLDCLDFAPEGVLELVKQLSVKLPLTDYNKRKALKDKTGFDLDAALKHIEEEKIEEQTPISAPTTGRRVVKEEPAAPARRTEGKYKIVEPK